jgi:hypothetical protein
MTILVKSSTREAAKNKWATRVECFLDGQHLFKKYTGKPFVLDVAAEPQTAKVDRFYLSPDWIQEQDDVNRPLYADGLAPLQEPDDKYSALRECHPAMQLLSPTCVGFDGLQCDWEDGWWCNPPFDRKLEFIAKAREEMYKGHDGMMLLPYEPLTGWWRDEVNGYASMIFEPDGRYGFYESDGHTKKTGVNFGSALVLFTKRGVMTPRETFGRGVWEKGHAA